MDFKINKRNEFVWKGAAASGAPDSPRRVQLPCGLSYCTGRGEEGKGEGSSREQFLSVDCSPQSFLFPPGTAVKYSLSFHTLNINYLRMGDVIVRIMVTLL